MVPPNVLTEKAYDEKRDAMKIPEWLPDDNRPARAVEGATEPLIQRLAAPFARIWHILEYGQQSGILSVIHRRPPAAGHGLHRRAVSEPPQC